MLKLVRTEVRFASECFPVPYYKTVDAAWQRLFDEHGKEVGGRPFLIDWERYQRIEKDGRLVWIVARLEDGEPIGYSGHYWYYDLHWMDRKIAADDLWFVTKEHRGQGIGRRLKQLGLEALRQQDVTASYDLIRRTSTSVHDSLASMGYSVHRMQWKIDL